MGKLKEEMRNVQEAGGQRLLKDIAAMTGGRRGRIEDAVREAEKKADPPTATVKDEVAQTALALSDTVGRLTELVRRVGGELAVMPTEDAARVFHGLDQIEKATREVREAARQRLLADVVAAEDAVVDEKGTATIFRDRWTVQRRIRRASKPDEEALRKLLAVRGVAPSAVFTAVLVEQLDAERLRYQIESGALPAAEVEPLYKETAALYVQAREV